MNNVDTYQKTNALVRFLTLLNSWLKFVGAHFPWSKGPFIFYEVGGAGRICGGGGGGVTEKKKTALKGGPSKKIRE